MQLHAVPVPSRTTERLNLSFHREQQPVPAWAMSLELSNPAGWLLPMAAFFCGAIASGQLAPDTTHAIRLGLGLVLAGPFLAGMNAVVNALFDRDLDAINHSERPLPSGKLSVNSVIAQMGLMGMVVTLYAHMLENGLGSRLDGVLGLGGSEQRGVFYLTIASLALIFAVNAPPLSLRRNTWWSGIFFGVLAVALPWLTGHLLFGPLSFISTAFAICFAFGAVGLLILAALNKVEGERRVGIRSLSALLGREVGMLIGAMLIDTAILAAAILAAPQGLLAVLALVGLCVLQVGLQVAFFRKPAMPVWALVTAACVFVAAMVTAAASLPGVSATLSLL